jgi:hypothetical protein
MAESKRETTDLYNQSLHMPVPRLSVFLDEGTEIYKAEYIDTRTRATILT